jgi:hypothetical protein
MEDSFKDKTEEGFEDIGDSSTNSDCSEASPLDCGI